MKPGVYKGLSFQEYLNIKAVNKSSLDFMAQSPAHFVAAKKAPPRKTDAMDLGNAIHCAILEPERFKTDYVMSPRNAPRYPSDVQRTAKKPSPESIISVEFWTHFEAKHKNKTIISPDEMAIARKLTRRVRKHPAAQVLLENGDAEIVLIWIDEPTGLLCKARLDWLTSGAILDFKSTRDASKDAFQKQIANMEWDVQAGFYSDGFKALFGEDPAFIFGALEKDGPSDAYYSASDEMIELGRSIYRKRMDTLLACKRDKKWPGYSDEIQPIGPTPWRLKELANAETE